jgi:hypothetical protein
VIVAAPANVPVLVTVPAVLVSAPAVATLAGGRFSNAGTVGGGLTNDGTTINDGTIAAATVVAPV